ncbi:MAG TPA: TRAP transporter large permease subunit [Candidatus Eisenbacteria bacterium]|uniref:TRAP transporter large permease subunit n=1 Tax=Eiseniibacteriota bacterium TaxID=2212470 RepID=A0A7V2ATD2_UNCEI|nr:TRAP transporter large permease subunit [Candidatus Eisenbacteria bacterium]
MPNLEPILVLAVVAGAMVLFMTGRLRVDVIALCVLVVLVVFGLIDMNQALLGFANTATATVAAMFVLSAGLVHTGLVRWLAGHLDRLAGESEIRLVFVLCATIAALSAFIVNTATVAIFIPVAVVLAKARNISPSRVLIPLSFASQFGGVCTLIGTSTNILINSFAVDNGMRSFGLFEFSRLGLVMAAAGLLYLVFVARRLLPEREGKAQTVDKYRLSDYFTELRVKEKSPLVGETWEESEAGEETDVRLNKIIRGEVESWRPRGTKIREGDILLLYGNADKLIEFADKYGLEMITDAAVDDEKLSSDKVKLFEVLVPPRSNLRGRTLKTSDFYRRYGGIVLAMQRRGEILRSRLPDIRLQGGDTLLLQGEAEDAHRLMKSSDLIVMNELTELYIRKDRAIVAILMLLAVVLLSVFRVVPIFVAALIGSVGMVLGGCITMEEAYKAIDWKVIFLLGGIIPLGLALERSGAANLITGTLLSSVVGSGPLVVLAVLYIVTAVLTEAMSNNATAVLLAPIALSLAAAMKVDPRPFLVAITFAASTSFATPIGYQTNTMVYAPGGYRFTDFIRTGGALNLLFWGLAVLLIPVIWPF